MCVTVHSPPVLPACLSLSDRTRNSTHLLLFAYVRTLRIRNVCKRELVAKNYCTFVAFALLAGCRFAVAGFLLLVVSIYGKLLKLYGNLLASLSVYMSACLLCVCAVCRSSCFVTRICSCYCFSFIGRFASFLLNTHTCVCM